MAKYYDPMQEKITILNILKYDAIQDTAKVIYKDMGDHLLMLVPMKNAKGHDTYRFYYDCEGKIDKIIGDNGNSGIVGLVWSR